MKVFLNPGHDLNKDPGAVGFNLRECDVARDVAALVDKYLTAAGVEVAGSLQDDSLSRVVSVANASGADFFVSIHCNSAANPSANGTEVWYCYGSAKGAKMAQCIQDQIVDALGTTDRGIKCARPGVNGLYVLTNTDMPAVLVELAFINNASDNSLLATKKDEFARAIARGVTDYQNL